MTLFKLYKKRFVYRRLRLIFNLWRGICDVGTLLSVTSVELVSFLFFIRSNKLNQEVFKINSSESSQSTNDGSHNLR